jgi:acid stress chaperone HdeB
MKKWRLVLIVLIVLFLIPVAQAQVTLDVAKISCREFLIGKFGRSTRSVANWLNGYYHGKSDSTVIETRAMTENEDKLERFCRKNRDMTIMEAAKHALGFDK